MLQVGLPVVGSGSLLRRHSSSRSNLDNGLLARLPTSGELRLPASEPLTQEVYQFSVHFVRRCLRDFFLIYPERTGRCRYAGGGPLRFEPLLKRHRQRCPRTFDRLQHLEQ